MSSILESIENKLELSDFNNAALIRKLSEKTKIKHEHITLFLMIISTLFLVLTKPG